MTQKTAPIVAIGLNTYPDGVVYWLPYMFGVRAPYPGVSMEIDTFESHYNQGFSDGAYEAAWRVGAAGLIAGAAVGIVGMLLFRK
jgi:hypothetical protein